MQTIEKKEVSFSVSHGDAWKIRDIARRAFDELPWPSRQKPKLIEIEMDITAAHANGCPLRLDALREADLVNLAHDIGGIRRHLNRLTGELEGCFVPRYAAAK